MTQESKTNGFSKALLIMSFAFIHAEKFYHVLSDATKNVRCPGGWD